MGLTYIGAGAAGAASSAPQPYYPTNASGDLIVMVVVVKPSTATITTPAGWTVVGSAIGGENVATGIDVGKTKVYFFTRIVTTVLTSYVNVSCPGSSSAQAIMTTWRADTGLFTDPVVTFGDDSTVGTDYSATGTGTLPFAADNVLVWGLSLAIDTAAVTPDSITASGSTFDVITEIADIASSLGDDIRFAKCYSFITAGGGTATPAFGATLAVGGAGPTGFMLLSELTTAVPVHLGTGTVVAGTSAPAPVPPAGVASGDFLHMTVVNRPNTVTPDTPSGWTQLNTGIGGAAVSESAGLGPVRTTTFTRVATGAETSAVTVTITGGASSLAVISAWRTISTASWEATSGGITSLTTQVTAWSAASSAMDVMPNDVILVGTGLSDDTLSSAAVMTGSGLTFTGATERAEDISGTGFDIALSLNTAMVQAGSGSVAVTHAMTLAAAEYGGSAFTRLRAVPPTPASLPSTSIRHIRQAVRRASFY